MLAALNIHGETLITAKKSRNHTEIMLKSYGANIKIKNKIINLKFLNYEKRIQTNNNRNIFSPIIIGMAFAFGWTPCIGPILGSILVLAATEESINKGIVLLFCYSLGLAIPFVLSGYLIQKFMTVSKNLKKNMNLITKTGGSLLLITGILIITNHLQSLGFYLLRFFPFLQSIG